MTKNIIHTDYEYESPLIRSETKSKIHVGGCYADATATVTLKLKLKSKTLILNIDSVIVDGKVEVRGVVRDYKKEEIPSGTITISIEEKDFVAVLDRHGRFREYVQVEDGGDHKVVIKYDGDENFHASYDYCYIYFVNMHDILFYLPEWKVVDKKEKYYLEKHENYRDKRRYEYELIDEYDVTTEKHEDDTYEEEKRMDLIEDHPENQKKKQKKHNICIEDPILTVEDIRRYKRRCEKPPNSPRVINPYLDNQEQLKDTQIRKVITKREINQSYYKAINDCAEYMNRRRLPHIPLIYDAVCMYTAGLLERKYKFKFKLNNLIDESRAILEPYIHREFRTFKGRIQGRRRYHRWM